MSGSRRYTRHLGRLTVQVERDKVRYFAALSQVSLGGGFLELTPAPSPGTQIVLRIMRPGGKTVSVPAEVRYSCTAGSGPNGLDGVGIAWGTLDDEATALVQEWVDRAQGGKPLRSSDDPTSGEGP